MCKNDTEINKSGITGEENDDDNYSYSMNIYNLTPVKCVDILNIFHAAETQSLWDSGSITPNSDRN